MINDDEKRRDAIDACRLLNEIILDFVVGTRSFGIYESAKLKPLTEMIKLGLMRMSTTHLFIALTKWSELYNRYKYLIPENARLYALILKKNIDQKNIREFRNKYIGHVIDNKTNQPLTIEETDTYVNRIIDNDLDKFLLWVNNPQANEKGRTVVGTTEYIRDQIMSEYNLSNDDVYPSNIS